MLKVILAHNSYNIRGGEDGVFDSELHVLKNASDVNVDTFYVHNSAITGFFSKIKVFLLTAYNFKVGMLTNNKFHQCDVAHVHNFFPLISPSIFYFLKSKRVASVLTLHNYRTVCPTALLMFNGMPCEESIINSGWWALKHKVYRNSFLGTLALIIQIELHKKLGTWQNKVDCFICLTEFSRQKFIEAGFPAHKLVVKPNFIEDPGYSEGSLRTGCPLFVGRLSVEKGLHVLTAAAPALSSSVDIVGEGDYTAANGLNYLGKKDKANVLNLMKNAPFLVMPSIWYEGFPMVIVEAFACGTPVVCSRLGSMAEIVEDGVTGLHFNPGDPEDLADKINYLMSTPAISRQMGENARQEYLKKYTPEKNLEMLLDIYQRAIVESRSGA